MSGFRVEHEYDRPLHVVWAALSDPELVPLWTSTGQGGRPDGFQPVVGTRFRFVGKPTVGWNGIVLCEVLAIDPPILLRYSWRNHDTDVPSVVTCRLEQTSSGTRLTWEHTEFHGVGGLVMARLLARVRRTMLTTGLPRLLEKLDDEGHLEPDIVARD